jgi:hypothetical protein
VKFDEGHIKKGESEKKIEGEGEGSMGLDTGRTCKLQGLDSPRPKQRRDSTCRE